MENSIVLSDAIQLLKNQPSNSIPLIITDIPYGINYHSNYYKNKNPHSPINNDWNFGITEFIKESARVITRDGALYLFSRWDVSPLWLPSIQSFDLKIKTKIIWEKNNWSAGDLNGSFGNQYEEILFITKGRHLLRGKRYSNIWKFPRIPAKQLLCPAQKPVPLLQRAIEASSDEGDLVVDPYAGSGSTGEAAKKSKRKFLLGDNDPRMINIARKRLGFPLLKDVGAKENIPLGKYKFILPDPEDWGIHPEELKFLHDELRENIEYDPEHSQMKLL